MPGTSPLRYGFPGYTGSNSGPGSAPYLASPGLVYQPPPQQPSSSYSPRSPGQTMRHGVGVKVERSPDSQGASSAGSSSSGRPPTAADSPGPGPDYRRRPSLIPPGFYYPDEMHDMFGMYLPGGQANSPDGEPHISHQWMNPGRFAHHYNVTSSGYVGSDVTEDAARINGAFAPRLV